MKLIRYSIKLHIEYKVWDLVWNQIHPYVSKQLCEEMDEKITNIVSNQIRDLIYLQSKL